MAETLQSGKRVLVVDDDLPLRTLLAKLLLDAGFQVETASDGDEAIAAAEKKLYDLMVLDVWMPKKNGLEVLKELSKAAHRPEKIIVMTADQTPETLLKALQDQAYHYIQKPFSPKAIVELALAAVSADTPPLRVDVLSAAPHWVELQVPCDRNTANRIVTFMNQLKADLPEDVRYNVGHAFRELLLNAIEWGGGLDPTRSVRISYLRSKRMLMYRIADPGAGFRFEGLTHAAISNPDDPVAHIKIRDAKGLRPGGFGILMSRAMVDELLYNEAQNEVVFVKYLHDVPVSRPVKASP